MMHYALKDYGAELSWNAGTLFCHDEVFFRILDFCRKFDILHPVKWAFGCIPSMMGSGMAISSINFVNMAKNVIDEYLDHGVACRLALMNPHADERMIKEDMINAGLMGYLNSNWIEHACNGVIVTSDILARHIRDTYPNLEVILSSIRPAYDVGYGMLNDTLEWYEEKLASPLYDVIEINNAKIHEDDFLAKISRKDKVELIACRDCIRNCPFTMYHFDSALEIMNGIKRTGSIKNAKFLFDEVNKLCVEYRKKNLDQASSYTRREIETLARMGYQSFQLSFRRNSDERVVRDMEEYLFEYKHLRYLQNLL